VNLRRGAVIGAGVVTAAGMAYVLERAGARRWRADDDAIAAAGLTLPPDIRHHFVPVSDGGRIHAVERGEGRPIVLLHGITLGIGTWAPQLRDLDGRVVALSSRGHGQSRAGTEGYGFDRLGSDLLEVLDALAVSDAVLVGHSMGGMVAQLLAVDRPEELARHVQRMVLVATSPGPMARAPLGSAFVAGATRVLGHAERRGRGPLPAGLTVWGARTAFGVAPSAAEVALVRGMLDAMSPTALAGLLPPLVAFDVRSRIGSIRLPTHVVGGSRDVLTPPRTLRAISARVPGATATFLPGCGHMVMLERPEELSAIVDHSQGPP
jgi:pimeloyl-ACP methyl ester carboxylesterase